MEQTHKEIIAIVAVIVVLANLVFFALKKIDSLTFWGIIILGAIIAYLLERVE